MSERLTMRKIRELLRLADDCGRSQRQIASSLSVAVGTISGHLQRARAAGLTWELVQGMTDSELDALLFRDGGRNQGVRRAPINYAHVHNELHKSTATLELLWTEYQEAMTARSEGLKPYQYSQFCELYAAWRVRLRPSMRRVHRAGEKAFLDYSGKKSKIFDRSTGEAHDVELFVMVLGASNYTYAEATYTQSLRDFVGSTIRGFEHYGGVPEVIVPEYVPRNIFWVLCPSGICGRGIVRCRRVLDREEAPGTYADRSRDRQRSRRKLQLRLPCLSGTSCGRRRSIEFERHGSRQRLSSTLRGSQPMGIRPPASKPACLCYYASASSPVKEARALSRLSVATWTRSSPTGFGSDVHPIEKMHEILDGRSAARSSRCYESCFRVRSLIGFRDARESPFDGKRPASSRICEMSVVCARRAFNTMSFTCARLSHISNG